jgi:hypothetical protein
MAYSVEGRAAGPPHLSGGSQVLLTSDGPEGLLLPGAAEEPVDVGHGLAVSVIQCTLIPESRPKQTPNPGDRTDAEMQL